MAVTASMLDWIFWLIGGAIGLLALWLLYWSLLKDRSRGRRRCPKCWYDMSGAAAGGMTCSECGYQPKQERRLFRTRRRWRWALIAAFVLMIGAAIVFSPKIKRQGWHSVVPTTALIMMMPELPTRSPGLYTELETRLGSDQLAGWQWKLLVRRCGIQVLSLFKTTIHARENWPHGEPVRFSAEVERKLSMHGWFNSRPVVVTIRPSWPGADVFAAHFDTRSRAYSRNGNRVQLWFGETSCCGQPPSNATAVEFDVSIALAGGSGEVRLDSTRMSMPMSWSGSLHDYVRPLASVKLEDWLRSSLHCYADEHRLWIKVLSGTPFPLDRGVTLAFTAELQCNGAVMATANAVECARAVQSYGRRNPNSGISLFGGFWEGDGAPLVNADKRGEWALRLRSNSQLALADFESDEYWDGDLRLPLKFDIQSKRWTSVDSHQAPSCRVAIRSPLSSPTGSSQSRPTAQPRARSSAKLAVCP
jgi:hypothetical protein